MYLRRCFWKIDGKRHAYWALVESYRTVRGPRQRVVSYLGEMDASRRVGVQACAVGKHQYELLEWVAVDVKRVSVERKCDFGESCRHRHRLRRHSLADDGAGARVGRLCNPSSELHLAEHSFASGALGELLGIPAEKVNDDRVYRALDQSMVEHVVGLYEKANRIWVMDRGMTSQENVEFLQQKDVATLSARRSRC